MISTPDRRQTIELIDQARQSGLTLTKACAALQISPRTYQRWCQGEQVKEDGRPEAQRPAPANKLAGEEREAILELCNQSEYQSLPPSQIVPRLADEGIYLASESSFYRVLRAAKQLQHRGKANAPQKARTPTAHRATGANQVWSWDITYLATTVAGLFLRLYLVMDIYSRKIVGWEIHEQELAEHAAQLIRKACWAEGITGKDLVLHADNGSPMKAATMLATLQRLGVVPSFSRPSVSNDNPYSESLFGTLKYTPAYPSKPFDSMDEARTWVLDFVRWYNEEHRHSGIQFVTPAQRHRSEDQAILGQRAALYERARERHPERWSGSTRNWKLVTEVWLNPENSAQGSTEMRELAA
jgi:transposase InsO family protein